ncbi:MAG: DUF1735 domain-containing protein [Bacteroidales bacterium]|jgi:hypothetical protein|nr:DUF1735 domain-containing protein [Bacteroidales bacterium]
MKKLIILMIAVIIGSNACKNFDVEYNDYKYSTAYFGYQFPVRILILGDYIYDNSNDNAHKFVISAHLGGVIDNKTDRKFSIEVDESLCNGVVFATGDPVVAMPASWYTLSSSSELIIPKGRQDGGIEVQLTEAFFADPNSIRNTYAVPIRLKGSNDVDSILSGRKDNAYPNPDPRLAEQWVVSPKDFVMFVVKYINEYEASYLKYGTSTVSQAGGTTETTTYKEKWVERNDVVKLRTTGRNTVEGEFSLQSGIMTGNVLLTLDFNGVHNGKNNCTVTGVGLGNTNYSVTGTGTFKTFDTEYDNFGQKIRQGMTINYTVTDGNTGDTYTAEETLVVRSRDVVLETYSVRPTP